MPAPRLTVVIPVYNEERILPSALADLTAGLEARRLDYEVLLAENGSTDGTPALLERLTAANPRLRWFHSTTPNYGAALKQGMLEARGELVFCDEIDLCDLSFYDQALELLGDPRPGHGGGEQGGARRAATAGRSSAGWRRGCTTASCACCSGSRARTPTGSRPSAASGWSRWPGPAWWTATCSPRSS